MLTRVACAGFTLAAELLFAQREPDDETADLSIVLAEAYLARGRLGSSLPRYHRESGLRAFSALEVLSSEEPEGHLLKFRLRRPLDATSVRKAQREYEALIRSARLRQLPNQL